MRLGRSLTLAATLALAALLVGCPWVNEKDFDAAWDADGDSWGIDEDCAPDDADVYPYAGDVRGDGCDADCSMELDSDGDDWPDDSDCGPTDPTIHPCSLSETVGDGVDSDCDGKDGVRTLPCPTGDPEWPDAIDYSEGGCPFPAVPKAPAAE
ncbi:MAG: hypothetical protein JXX28_09325 [Deltaproteobacteria bacterium]|nr:hypothetical protein [Deltaproteobacteria bacterium]